MSLPSGTQLGPYRIEKPVGRGGQALVYRAHDPRLDSHVAVKVLADNHAFDPEMAARFGDEARALRSIRSSAVATVFDVGHRGDGQPYIVLEYADRGSLDERLNQRSGATVADVRLLVDVLAESMTALHSAGLVHRDIKPSNVLIRSSRRAKRADGALIDADDELFLGDFGLAKSLDDASGLTVGAGTSRYAAPEQWRTVGVVDHRADIHAATALLTQVMIGAPAGDSTWSDHVKRRLARGALRDALLTGLAADPANRPPRAERWAQDLRSALADLPDGPVRAGGPRRRLLVAAAVVFLLAAAMLVWNVGPAGGPERAEVDDGDLLAAAAPSSETTVGSFNSVSAAVDPTPGADSITDDEPTPEDSNPADSLDDDDGIDGTADSATDETADEGSTTPSDLESEPGDRSDTAFDELTGSAGSSDELRAPTSFDPNPSRSGWASFRCRVAHMGPVEPVGVAGAVAGIGHSTFFGNTDVVASTSGESIAASGNSTCAGGTLNRSSYRLTTLVDPLTAQAVPIEEMNVRYTTTVRLTDEQLERIEAFPVGSALAVGRPSVRTEGEAGSAVAWGCTGSGEGRAEAYIWACPPGTDLTVTLVFSQCWNGEEGAGRILEVTVAQPGTGCPSSHPRPLPAVRLVATYDLAGIDDSTRLRVSTDAVDAELGGLSMAGGMIHGWEDGAFEEILDSCLRPRLDCSNNITGPGRALAMPPS